VFLHDHEHVQAVDGVHFAGTQLDVICEVRLQQQQLARYNKYGQSISTKGRIARSGFFTENNVTRHQAVGALQSAAADSLSCPYSIHRSKDFLCFSMFTGNHVHCPMLKWFSGENFLNTVETGPQNGGFGAK